MDLLWLPMKIAQGPTLEEGACDVWLLSLKQGVSPHENVLSPKEKERAARFVLPQVRDRFVVARGLMRQLLGHYLGVAPEGLDFSVSTAGKPYLAAYPHLHFNVSHSDDYGLFAVTTVAPVGVDIEKVSATVDSEGLVHRFFSLGEQQQFDALERDSKKTAFFNGWCAKEAWVKAHGSTLAEGLKHSDVVWNKDGTVQSIGGSGEGSYDVCNLPAIEGLSSHCVVLGKLTSWRCYQVL